MKSRLRAFSLLLLCWILLAAHAAIGKKIPPGAPLDLNTATAAQLAKVPRIGASSPKAIVQFREKSGPFVCVEDLLAIRGTASVPASSSRFGLTSLFPNPCAESPAVPADRIFSA